MLYSFFHECPQTSPYHDLQEKFEKLAGKLDILSKQKIGPTNNEKHEN